MIISNLFNLKCQSIFGFDEIVNLCNVCLWHLACKHRRKLGQISYWYVGVPIDFGGGQRPFGVYWGHIVETLYLKTGKLVVYYIESREPICGHCNFAILNTYITWMLMATIFHILWKLVLNIVGMCLARDLSLECFCFLWPGEGSEGMVFPPPCLAIYRVSTCKMV